MPRRPYVRMARGAIVECWTECSTAHWQQYIADVNAFDISERRTLCRDTLCETNKWNSNKEIFYGNFMAFIISVWWFRRKLFHWKRCPIQRPHDSRTERIDEFDKADWRFEEAICIKYANADAYRESWWHVCPVWLFRCQNWAFVSRFDRVAGARIFVHIYFGRNMGKID